MCKRPVFSCVYVCTKKLNLKKMIANHISLFSADFIPPLCHIFESSVYFLGRKTRNKILYPMMLLALRSPHLEGPVIFGHLRSSLSLFHPSAAGAPTPFLAQSRRSTDSSCIRSLLWMLETVEHLNLLSWFILLIIFMRSLASLEVRFFGRSSPGLRNSQGRRFAGGLSGGDRAEPPTW